MYPKPKAEAHNGEPKGKSSFFPVDVGEFAEQCKSPCVILSLLVLLD